MATTDNKSLTRQEALEIVLEDFDLDEILEEFSDYEVLDVVNNRFDPDEILESVIDNYTLEELSNNFSDTELEDFVESYMETQNPNYVAIATPYLDDQMKADLYASYHKKVNYDELQEFLKRYD